MTETKMKPATALPWHTRGPARGVQLFIEAPKTKGMPYGLDVCGDDYTGYGDDAAREQNMRFITHACNSYPQLVARIRNNLLVHDEMDEDGNGAITCTCQQCGANREVLRSLGELE